MGFLKNLFASPKNEVNYNEDLADFVNEEYTRRQTERKPFELQWRLNQEFLNGNQFLDINTVSQTIEEIPKLYWHQQREVFNQIATIAETRIARLGRAKPLLKVRPASSDDSDISAAKVSSMLLGSYWSEQEMDANYEDFISWLELQGTSFWKASWNAKKGRIIGQQPAPQDPQAEELQTEENDIRDESAGVFQQGENLIEIREGDIETVVVPAHEVFPDSNFRGGMKDVRSFIHARAYHINDILETWGQAVEGEEVDVMTLQRSASGMGGLGYSYGALSTTVSKLKDHAVVKEYYEMPSKKYPKGRFIVVAGGKTLYAGPMPYMIGTDGEVQMPFVRCVAIDRPGCFWGKTVIERCIPVQRRYNALRNRKSEYLNLVAIGQWYEPVNSVDDDTELNNAPGNRIRYRPGPQGQRPEPVTFPSLPASFENEETTLMQEFTAISGISELSRFGQAPSGVKSGVALGIANEQDDTRIATSSARISESVKKLGKYWLRLSRQFVQEPRLLRWIGPNREVDVREWTVSDLKSDDVIIENSSALAETPSQRRQMVFDLLNAGLFNRPDQSPLTEEARQRIFQLLEFGHWETGAEDDLALQTSRAKRENRQMMDGQPVHVMDFDDHEIHIHEIDRMRMQAEYEELMKTPIGPYVEQMMVMHKAEHSQALQEIQAQQMAEQIAQQSLQAQASAKPQPPGK